MIDRPPGYILAGGRALRMGGARKHALVIGGRTILCHLVHRFTDQLSGIYLNTADDSDIRGLNVPLVRDRADLGEQQGPLAGLLTCLAHAASMPEQPKVIVTLPGDCPFLPRALIETLLTHLGHAPAVIAESGGQLHPLCGIWRLELTERLENAFLHEGVRSARAFAEIAGAKVVTFENAPFDPFFNINTPDDLKQAEAIWQECGEGGTASPDRTGDL